MPSLYHYTTKAGKDAILESKKIKKSKAPVGGGDDARYGSGVYLTSLPPSTPKHDLAWNNYDTNTRLVKIMIGRGKADFVFQFDSEDLPGVEKVGDNTDRDIWLFRDADIDLDMIQYSYSEVK